MGKLALSNYGNHISNQIFLTHVYIIHLELDHLIQEQGLGVNITVLSIYKEVHDQGNLSVNDRNEKKFKNAKPQSGMINIFDKEMKELSIFSSTAKSKGIFMYKVSDILYVQTKLKHSPYIDLALRLVSQGLFYGRAMS